MQWRASGTSTKWFTYIYLTLLPDRWIAEMMDLSFQISMNLCQLRSWETESIHRKTEMEVDHFTSYAKKHPIDISDISIISSSFSRSSLYKGQNPRLPPKILRIRVVFKGTSQKTQNTQDNCQILQQLDKCFLPLFTAWWLSHPSEKYGISQLGWWNSLWTNNMVSVKWWKINMN